MDGLTRDSTRHLGGLRRILRGEIVKRSRTINTITQTIGEKEIKLGSPGHPVNSFLFLKPANINGARLSGTLTRTLFKGRSTVVHISVSRCVRGRSISGVVKSPPKCINRRRNKRLDSRIHARPCSIVLFSRVRGTRPSMFGMLLRILSSKRVASSRKEGISFSGAIVVVASGTNTGTVIRPGGLKFTAGRSPTDSCGGVGRGIVSRIGRVFHPRFLGQVSRVVMFRSLNGRRVGGVISLVYGRFAGHLGVRVGVSLGLHRSTGDLVIRGKASTGCKTEPLHHTLRARLRSGLTSTVLGKRVQRNSRITTKTSGGKVRFIGARTWGCVRLWV